MIPAMTLGNSCRNPSGRNGDTLAPTPAMASMETQNKVPRIRCGRSPLRAISTAAPESIPILPPPMWRVSKASAADLTYHGAAGSMARMVICASRPVCCNSTYPSLHGLQDFLDGGQAGLDLRKLALHGGE